MIFETWFLLACVAALVSGFGAFALKVAAIEQLDINTLAFCSSILSSCILLVCVYLFSNFSGLTISLLFIACGVAITFLITKILKVTSLQYIDSAIFFPLYKVFSPMIVIVFGVAFFHERFSMYEWCGLVLGLLVPLILITKQENSRQANLFRGVAVLILASALAAVSASLEKYGTSVIDNIWLFLLLTNVFVIITAYISMRLNNKGSLPDIVACTSNSIFLKVVVVGGLTSALSGAAFVFALVLDGPLGITYTILSLYILIPIVLSIIFYKEHWNTRKVIAIVLSIVALAFFG